MAIQQLFQLIKQYRLDINIGYYHDEWTVDVCGLDLERVWSGPDLDEVLQRCLDDVNHALALKTSQDRP